MDFQNYSKYNIGRHNERGNGREKKVTKKESQRRWYLKNREHKLQKSRERYKKVKDTKHFKKVRRDYQKDYRKRKSTSPNRNFSK